MAAAANRSGHWAQDFVWLPIASIAALSLCAFLVQGMPGRAALTQAMVDSESYLRIGNAFWEGHIPPADLLGRRGFLYPFVAVGLLRVSPLLLLGIQCLSVGLTVAALAQSERSLTGRVIVSPVALLSVSLLASAGTLMTESMSIALAATALRDSVAGPARFGRAAVFWSLAAAVKPIFLPVAAMFAVVAVLRSNRRLMLAGLIALPWAVQLALTSAGGQPSILQTTGSENLGQRFVPAVLAMETTGEFGDYRSPYAVAVAITLPEAGDKLRYLLHHPAASLRAWGMILWRFHLTAPSGFTQNDNHAADTRARLLLRHASLWLNPLLLATAMAGLGGAFLALKSGPSALRLAALSGPIVVLLAPLAYYQGDRLILPGLLLLLPFAGLAIAPLFRRA